MWISFCFFYSLSFFCPDASEILHIFGSKTHMGSPFVKIHPKIFTKLPSYPHSLFSRFFAILKTWRNTEMNYEGLETKLIQKQYIRQLEEQLAVYEKKNKAQELLIEQLNQSLDLLAGEISRLKTEKEDIRKEK